MLDKIKNDEIGAFNESVKEQLTTLALDAVKAKSITMQESKLDKRFLFITEMFDFLGLENVEYEDGEISALTNSINVVRLADEQLQETHVEYVIEVLSEDGENVEFDEMESVDKTDLDLEVYQASPGDVFVITVFTDSLTEGSNPLKRTSQKVIRGGKRVRKLVKNKEKGFKRGSDGKTKRQKGKEKINRKRGSRKAARTARGGKAAKVRKFKRSSKKSQKIKNRNKRRA